MKKNILLIAIGIFSSMEIALCQPACFNINPDAEMDSAHSDFPAFVKSQDAEIIIISKDSNYHIVSNMYPFDEFEYDIDQGRFILGLPPTSNRQVITITKTDCPSFKPQEIVINSLTTNQVLYYYINVPEFKPLFETGTLYLYTTPADAVVEIEGMPDYQKRSPINAPNIRAGYWPIHILKNGYRRFDTTIYISPNDITNYAFTLSESNDPAHASQEPSINVQEPNSAAATLTQDGSSKQSVQQQGNSQSNSNQYSSSGNYQYTGTGTNQYSGSGYTEQTSQPNYQPFYDRLNEDGNWVQDPNYGYVWYPNANTESGFAPYSSNGYWTYTSYGWTWVSNYSWGAIPFHYGRWGCDIHGWYWVPGSQWGPAWVNWCSTNDGYYGWAPLRPGISATDCNIYWIPSERYVFVQQQYITYENVSAYYLPRENNSYYVRTSTVISECSYDNNQNPVYIHGPKRQEVEYALGKSVYMRVTQSQQANPTMSYNSNFVSIDRPPLNHVNKNSVAPEPPYVFDRSYLTTFPKNNNSEPAVQRQQYNDEAIKYQKNQPITNNNNQYRNQPEQNNPNRVNSNSYQAKPTQNNNSSSNYNTNTRTNQRTYQNNSNYRSNNNRSQNNNTQRQRPPYNNRQPSQRQQQPYQNNSRQNRSYNSNHSNNSQQHH